MKYRKKTGFFINLYKNHILYGCHGNKYGQKIILWCLENNIRTRKTYLGWYTSVLGMEYLHRYISFGPREQLLKLSWWRVTCNERKITCSLLSGDSEFSIQHLSIKMWILIIQVVLQMLNTKQNYHYHYRWQNNKQWYAVTGHTTERSAKHLINIYWMVTITFCADQTLFKELDWISQVVGALKLPSSMGHKHWWTTDARCVNR